MSAMLLCIQFSSPCGNNQKRSADQTVISSSRGVAKSFALYYNIDNQANDSLVIILLYLIALILRIVLKNCYMSRKHGNTGLFKLLLKKNANRTPFASGFCRKIPAGKTIEYDNPLSIRDNPLD
jgi:hypothetical protein